MLKAFKKLKSIKSKTSRHKQKSCTKAEDPVGTYSGMDAGDDAVVVIEPIGVLVPGICVFNWFAGKFGSKASSRKV